MTDIAAIVTAHAEGEMARASWLSLLDAVGVARAAGLAVEVRVMLDNPTDETLAVFDDVEEHGAVLEVVSFADHAPVRNRAVEQVAADYVAFLDGDDLWSANWLVEAHRVCAAAANVVAHPELNWFFGLQHNLYFLPDQDDPEFDPAFLRIANPWDVLCMAPRAAYLDHPRTERALRVGYAYEDWHWNLETFADGYAHRVVPGTIHFKRRQAESQLTRAQDARVLTRPSALLDYTWWQERDRRV